MTSTTIDNFSESARAASALLNDMSRPAELQNPGILRDAGCVNETIPSVMHAIGNHSSGIDPDGEYALYPILATVLPLPRSIHTGAALRMVEQRNEFLTKFVEQLLPEISFKGVLP